MLVKRKISWQYYGQRVNAISPLVLWNMVMPAIGFVFSSLLISPNKRLRPHIAVFVENGDFLSSGLAYLPHVSGENGHRKRIFSEWRFLKCLFAVLELVVGCKQRFLKTIATPAQMPENEHTPIKDSTVVWTGKKASRGVVWTRSFFFFFFQHRESTLNIRTSKQLGSNKVNATV